FKIINDSLGHQVGDELLIKVAARIKECLREIDTLARLGGDEFAIILPDINQAQGGTQAAHRIIQAMTRPFALDRHEVSITASIGVTLYPMDGEDKDLLLQHADTAMYTAKEKGRNNYQFYTSEMNIRAKERLLLENSLRLAMDHKQLILHYQPRLELVSGRIIGMEALVRWQHPEMGLMPPAKFISIAEETGLIFPIGEWILKTACQQTKTWTDAGLGPFQIAVNLSGRQFRQPLLPDLVAGILDETGLDPRQLELELKESIIMQDLELVTSLMTELKRIGLLLSIDDFGTGYSSLHNLRRFPIDTLKMDSSFIRDMNGNDHDQDIVRAIIAFGHNLRLRVLAEGVETEQQLSILVKEGCDEMQGNYFAPPLPAWDFEKLILGGRRLWKL
ncbi:MAG: EAL domain-containing protein, partial [Deltaproteobacteria bacterium]|nr:EAL domain-containing protein [Deltaproteobacteria bacterium]